MAGPQYHVGPTEASWNVTDARSNPRVDRSAVMHPNPSHQERPAVLPWNQAGAAVRPARTLPALTIARASGVRR